MSVAGKNLSRISKSTTAKDKIILRGLPVSCVIGVFPAERTAPQTLFFDLELRGDFSIAGQTDDLNDAVDYIAVERCVKDFAAGTAFHLLERLAYACAEELLEKFPLLDSVTLGIRKPDAPVESGSVMLEITQHRVSCPDSVTCYHLRTPAVPVRSD